MAIVRTKQTDGSWAEIPAVVGPPGKDGATGKDGKEGATPVKYVDYWTSADQESIVQDVLAALGTPVFGRVDADNNIILTGELADGTYVLKYEDAEGNLTEIGTLEHGSYKNLADPTSADWLNGQRLNSSGEVKTEAVAYTTNYIPLKVGDVVRIRGLNIYFYNSASGYSTVHFYNESKARVGKITPYNSIAHFGHTTAQSANPPTDVVYTVGNGTVEMSSGDTSGIRYARFVGRLIDGFTVDDIIITVNQEITD